MNSDLTHKPLERSARGAWDDFAAASPDAWLFHTTLWLDYMALYAQKSYRTDLSFWIFRGDAPLAVVPVLLEDLDGKPSLSFAGEPLAAPALAPGLLTGKRREVLEFAVDRLRDLAAERSIARFQLRYSAMAPSFAGSALPQANPFLRLGALDLPFQTQLVDLRADLSALWSDVRHGTQSEIRKGEKNIRVLFHDAKTLTDEKFTQYQALHAKDAGRVTRSQATFDAMRSWVRSGRAVLAEAAADAGPAGFAVILLFGAGAYYGSSCKDPDQARLPSSHLIQWKAFEWLKARGIRFYDLGQQHFENQWFSPASAKAASISLFKRGLGGVSVPLPTAEFHSDAGELCRSLEERAAAYRNAAQQPPKA